LGSLFQRDSLKTQNFLKESRNIFCTHIFLEDYKNRDFLKNPAFSQKIPKFLKKSQNVSKNPKISQKIPKFLKTFRIFSKNPAFSRKIMKFLKKSQNFSKNPKISQKIPHFLEKSRIFSKNPAFSQNTPKFLKKYQNSKNPEFSQNNPELPQKIRNRLQEIQSRLSRMIFEIFERSFKILNASQFPCPASEEKMSSFMIPAQY
jgi:hypothetical protein